MNLATEGRPDASPTFPMMRAVGLGLTQEAIEGAVAALLADTSAERVEWTSMLRLPADSRVPVQVVARATGWEEGEAMIQGPWTRDRSTFLATHTGAWRCVRHPFSVPGQDHSLAVAVGFRRLHWPAAQRAHRGAWVFGGGGRHLPEGERLAFREAMAFADALAIPDEVLAEAIARHEGDTQRVLQACDAPHGAVERRLVRLLGAKPAWFVEPRLP